MLKTARVLGLPATVGSVEKVTGAIIREVRNGNGCYVCVANVHMVTTAKQDADLCKVMEDAFLVTTDGLPLVWVLRQQGFKEAERVTGTDLTLKLCEIAAEKKIRVYFYGGYPETINALKTVMAERFPDLKVVGYESPPLLPLHPEIDQDLVVRINKSGAEIVFVGLGCPKQELWMEAYSPHLPAVLIGVGAAFDFIAGTVKRAPVWMQKFGLEWLHRLAIDPRKTWKRYAITNPVFIWMVLKEYTKRKEKGG